MEWKVQIVVLMLVFGTVAAGEWVQITTDTPDIQTGGTRGVFSGWQYPP